MTFLGAFASIWEVICISCSGSCSVTLFPSPVAGTWASSFYMCALRTHESKKGHFYAGWEKCLTPGDPDNVCTCAFINVKSQTWTHLLQKRYWITSPFSFEDREFFKLSIICQCPKMILIWMAYIICSLHHLPNSLHFTIWIAVNPVAPSACSKHNLKFENPGKLWTFSKKTLQVWLRQVNTFSRSLKVYI